MAGIAVAINATFNIDSVVYVANLNVPTSTTSGTNPLVFNVTAEPAGATAATDLLTVAIGGTNEIYVAVAPPQYVIQAAVGDIVTALDVVVSEGTWDAATQQFTTSS